MRVLTEAEVDQVSGGVSREQWRGSAYAIMGLGVAGGPTTVVFGVAIGLSMLYVDYRLH